MNNKYFFLLPVLILLILNIFNNFGIMYRSIIFEVLLLIIALFFGSRVVLKEYSSSHLQVEYSKNQFNLSIVTISIIFGLLSFFILSINLDRFDFQEDEFQVVSTAVGHYHENNFYKWNFIQNISGKYTTCVENDPFCNYTRAWPHTLLISKSYNQFGISEWSSRIVSVVFGALFAFMSILISYLLFKDVKVSLLVGFSVIFYVNYIEIFRTTRMYALLIPFFLLLMIFTYYALIKKFVLLNELFKNNKFVKFYQKYFNFNPIFILIALILLMINYILHINSLILLVFSYFFLIFLLLKYKNEYKYKIIFIFLTFLLIILIIFGFVSRYDEFISFFAVFNIEYLWLLLNHPFSITLNVLFLSLGTIYMFKDSNIQDLLVYTYLALITSAMFFIFIAYRYISYNYISHLSIIVILVVIFSFVKTLNLISKNTIFQSIMIILFIMVIISHFSTSVERIYLVDQNKGEFSTAYKTILDNFDSVNDVLISQYLRDYYMQGLVLNNSVSLLNSRRFSFEKFEDAIQTYEQGWVVWEVSKSNHIKVEIIIYAFENFKQYHGTGIDSTNVNVFYFNSSMIN